MNTLLMIVAAAMILAIGVFVLVKLKHKQKIMTRLHNAVRHLIQKNKLAIANLEFFNNKIIGIDKKNRKLIFVQMRKGAIEKFCIDLRLASTCRVVKTNNDDEIFLQLHLKNSNDLPRFNFFNSSIDRPRNKMKLLEKAREWKKRVGNLMRGSNHSFQWGYVV